MRRSKATALCNNPDTLWQRPIPAASATSLPRPAIVGDTSRRRSQSMYDSGERAGWGDRNGLDATSPRKELGRGSISDNWRSREPAGGDDRWRVKVPPRPADKWGT